MATTYNPYDAVYQIYKQKALYTDAYKKNMENPNQQYKDTMAAARSSAAQWYDELRNSGYGSLADELNAADLTTAQQILSRYSPTPSPQQAITSSLGSAGSSSFPSYLVDLSQLATPSPQAQQANQAALAQAQAIYNAWQQNNAQAQAQGQRLSDETYKWIQNLYNQGIDIKDYALSTNPYVSEIGKAIMASYQQQGDTAARDVTAELAGGNAGNIDSYSAANAKRQQLAFTNAGNQAILADHNARVANALAVLETLGVNTQGLLGIEQQNVDSARRASNEILSGANTAMGTATSSANESDRISKSLLSDLSGYLSGILQTENTNASNLSGILDTNRTDLEKARLDSSTQLTKARLDSETQKILAQMQNTSAENVAKIKGQYDLLVQEAANKGVISQNEANKYIAMIDAEARKYASDKSLEGTKYTADAEATTSWLDSVAKSNTGAVNDSNPAYSNLRAAIESLADRNKSSYDAAGAEVLAMYAQHPAYSAIKQLIEAIVKELNNEEVTSGSNTTQSPGAVSSGWSGVKDLNKIFGMK